MNFVQTPIIIESQGEPIVGSAHIIARSERLLVVEIATHTKWCCLLDARPVGEKGVEVSIGSTEASLNCRLGAGFTVVRLPEFIGWKVLVREDEKTSVKLCLTR